MRKSKNQNPLYRQMPALRIRKGDLRRAEIVDAAVSCLSEGGFENFNFNTIGKRLGLARSHIAHYFPDKREILYLVYHDIYLRLQQLVIEKLAAAMTPEDQVEAIVDATVEGLGRERGPAIALLLFQHVCAHDQSYRSLATEVRQIGAERIAQILKGFDHLMSHPVRHRLQIARAIQSMIVGVMVESFSTEWIKSRSAMKTQALELVSAYIESLRLQE